MTEIEGISQQLGEDGLVQGGLDSIAKDIAAGIVTGKHDPEQAKNILARARQKLAQEQEALDNEPVVFDSPEPKPKPELKLEETEDPFEAAAKFIDQRNEQLAAEDNFPLDNDSTEDDSSTSTVSPLARQRAIDALSGLIDEVDKARSESAQPKPANRPSNQTPAQTNPASRHPEPPIFPRGERPRAEASQNYQELLRDNPVAAFLMDANRQAKIEIFPGMEIKQSDISEALFVSLYNLIKEGYFYSSQEKAQASEARSLAFVPIGPSVTFADRSLLALLTPSNFELPIRQNLAIKPEYRLYFKRAKDSEDKYQGITTLFNASSGGKVGIVTGKYEDTSDTADISVDALNETPTKRNDRSVNMLLSGKVLGTTLSGLDDSFPNIVYRAGSVPWNDFHFDQLLVLEQPKVGTGVELPSKPVQSVIEGMNVLKEYYNYGKNDMFVVFTPGVIKQLEAANLAFTTDGLPKIAFLGPMAEVAPVVQRMLASLSKESQRTVAVYLQEKSPEHTKHAGKTVFNGTEEVEVYPYYYTPGTFGFGKGLKPTR